MYRLILPLLTLVSSQLCAQQHIICDSHLQSVHPTFSYVAPHVAAVQKQAIVVDKHVDNHAVQNDQVIDALGIIATQAQQYQAMIAGLQSLGFAGQQHCNQQSVCVPQQQAYAPQQAAYVPFANAPYAAGTTAYGVRNVQIDAFGPQDVREIMASISRYSTQANSGANNLMGQANSLADRIAQSVAADADAALRVATIDAETRGAATTSQALIAMAQVMSQTLTATKPQQQTRINVQEQTGTPQMPNPLPPLGVPNDQPSHEFQLLNQHCVKCHSPDMAEPKGDFRLGLLTEVEADTAIQLIYEGKMPPESSLLVGARSQLAEEIKSLVGDQ